MANGMVYDENRETVLLHDQKLVALEEMVESMNGRPLLAAYWFQHDLKRIKERFPDARVIQSNQDIEEWNKGKIPLGLIHPASSGHGLNLQAGGHTICWFGLTWSLELYQQLNARLWRQGQKETVVVHHIITKSTMDEQVMKRLKEKDISQQSLIDAVKYELREEEADG